MRKSPAGVATTDLVLSVHRGGSADVFPEVAKLWITPGAIVADVTAMQCRWVQTLINTKKVKS